VFLYPLFIDVRWASEGNGVFKLFGFLLSGRERGVEILHVRPDDLRKKRSGFDTARVAMQQWL
jgi:hypothetical protein